MLEYPLDCIARVLDARVRGTGTGTIRRVCTDSRKIAPGDLFFALSGENFDAHRFVGEALARGAVAAVVDGARSAGLEPANGTLLEVADPLLALGALGAWH